MEPARVRPIYFPLPDRIVPAYYLEILAATVPGVPADAYAYVIAADDGRLLYREDLTHHDTFNYRVWADTTGDKRPHDGPLALYNPHPTPTPDGSYPKPVPANLIAIDGFNKTMDPWLPTGAAQTQGNNVDAYTDDNKPEGFSTGDTRALITSGNTFDHVYDLTAGPQSSLEQREAAVTEMFYVTNWLHDWWYDSGFDEKGGNAQTDNYGRGGVAGDPLLAEGQFGNGATPKTRNNSNMDVPADGMSPRMHMFLWDGVGSASLTLQPGGLMPGVGTATFGPQSFSVTGPVVLADDGTAPDANDACEALVNGAAVSGNVALVNRGTCTFKTKAQNAQAAGAVGVILADDKTGEPAPPMADDTSLTTAVTIPVLSVSQIDGGTIKGGLPGLTATLTRAPSIDRDGTIDNSVVAHEWGHYLHLRHVACGTQQCLAQSEGWADFDAMMMTLRPGDDLGGTYALGQYAFVASTDDPAYFGVRRYPYSVDLTKSPLTFKYIADGVLPSGVPYAKGNAVSPNSEVHAAGEIWASMLFEGYVAMLQQASEGASPPYTFDEGRRRMSDYVVGGMTLAPANPTYTEQRDAVLAAAAAADPADLAILAQGFAKRGAGTCAVSPARDSTTFSGVVESFTVGPDLTITAVTVDDSVKSCDGADGYLDAGETGKVTVHVTNAGAAPLTGATATVMSTTAGVTFPSGTTVSFGNVGVLATGSGSVEIALDPAFSGKKNLALQVILGATAGCTGATFTAAPFVNVTEVPASSAIDDVEARATAWTRSGTLAPQIWSRVETTPGNHAWLGIDYGAPSDTSLVSPPLDVSATLHLVLSFEHSHSFETSSNTNWDGGVIEVSTDGGKTWGDISMYGTPSYGGMIGDPANMAMNVLKGRQGYVATNPSWPATDTVSIDMGTALAGKTAQIRFRIGTDDAGGDVGWQLDNIGFTGITNTPFASLAPDTVPCTGSSSSSGGGAGGSGAGGSGAGGSGGPGGSGGHLYASGGCDCEAAGQDPQGRALAAPLLALAVLLGRRSRRARRPG